jgi:hypothetical protein
VVQLINLWICIFLFIDSIQYHRGSWPGASGGQNPEQPAGLRQSSNAVVVKTFWMSINRGCEEEKINRSQITILTQAPNEPRLDRDRAERWDRNNIRSEAEVEPMELPD